MLRAKPKELRWATLPKTLRSLVELTKTENPDARDRVTC